MAMDDGIRWNERYRTGDFKQLKSPRTFLVEYQHFLPSQGLALDVAMGLGGNAALLRSRGLRVIGVDVSNVAVCQAKFDHPELDIFLADLRQYRFPPASFDVIVNFYYLNRLLWSEFPFMLKPGGLLVIETLTQEMGKVKPEIDSKYLLNNGELESFFPGLETLHYREGWMAARNGSQKAVASLIARKKE